MMWHLLVFLIVTLVSTAVAAAGAAAAEPGMCRVDEFTVEARLQRPCDVVKWITGHSPEMPEVQKR